jgi:hypothetical protein
MRTTLQLQRTTALVLAGLLSLAGTGIRAHAQTVLFEVVTANGSPVLVADDRRFVGIGLADPQKALDIATRGGIRIGRTEFASDLNEIYFEDNGQIRSRDNNHRIVFDRANNVMELREFGSIILSAGATQGQRTSTMEVSRNRVIINGASLAAGQGNEATGLNTAAFGTGTRALAHSAAAFGANTLASGLFSTAMGQLTTADANNSTALGSQASTNRHVGSFVYGDASTLNTNAVVHASRANQFVVRAQHFWLGTVGSATSPANHFITTTTGAFLSTGGSWVNSSDVNRKENFRLEDGERVLRKIATLSIPSWNYKHEDVTVRHLGPTAQDFHAAFGLGGDDTGIGTVDIAGVTLLAVQALERRTAELGERTREVESLRDEVAVLRAEVEQSRRERAADAERLARLEAVVEQLRSHRTRP